MKKGKPCKNNFGSSEKTFWSLGWNLNIHLTSECRALSCVALNRILELGNNRLLISNTCPGNGERDVFIRCRSLTKMESEISDLKRDEKFSNLEKKFTELFDFKLADLMLNYVTKLQKTMPNRGQKRWRNLSPWLLPQTSNQKWNQEISTPHQASEYKGLLKIPKKLLTRNLSQLQK